MSKPVRRDAGRTVCAASRPPALAPAAAAEGGSATRPSNSHRPTPACIPAASPASIAALKRVSSASWRRPASVPPSSLLPPAAAAADGDGAAAAADADARVWRPRGGDATSAAAAAAAATGAGAAAAVSAACSSVRMRDSVASVSASDGRSPAADGRWSSAAVEARTRSSRLAATANGDLGSSVACHATSPSGTTRRGGASASSMGTAATGAGAPSGPTPRTLHSGCGGRLRVIPMCMHVYVTHMHRAALHVP